MAEFETSLTDASECCSRIQVLTYAVQLLSAALDWQTQSLLKVEHRAQFYFNLAPEYILLVRVKRDRSVVFEDLNPATETMYGRKRAEVVGAPLADIVPANAALDIERCARACYDDGKVKTYKVSRRFADGPEFVIDVVAALVEKTVEGEGLVLFTSRDITDQRRLEEQLRQSHKMEAVGQLTGGLAHDFNNLLTGIRGNLELIQRRVAQGRIGDIERHVAAAQDGAARAAALTDRLLAFPRRKALDPKLADANILVRGLEDLIRRTVGTGIVVEVDTADDPCEVVVDPSSFENAILNLCINARDAMPEGGKLIIETAVASTEDGRGTSRNLQLGQCVTVSVGDNGTGMSPDVVARAFDPFFTTKPAGVGTGLGLSMVYGFAEQSGGRVILKSEKGGGTTVTLFLPRHRGGSGSTAE